MMPQSKDPTLLIQPRSIREFSQSVLPSIWRDCLSTLSRVNHLGVLRLRRFSASRRICSAQDDDVSQKFLVPDLVSSRFQHADALVLRRIHIDRNAVYPGQALREDVPAAFVLGEIQKISLSVHFELQFPSPLGSKTTRKTSHEFHGFSRMPFGLQIRDDPCQSVAKLFAVLTSCPLHPRTPHQ